MADEQANQDWTKGPVWKPMRGTAKRERDARKVKADTREGANKTKARKGDDYACRFPRCFCHRAKIAPHVAHLEHKGVGGNPAGDRSDEKLLICLCPARHRESRVSLDQKSIRIVALTMDGTRGPCEFWVDIHALEKHRGTTKPKWFLVGTERELHIFEPFTREQIVIGDLIAEIAA